MSLNFAMQEQSDPVPMARMSLLRETAELAIQAWKSRKTLWAVTWMDFQQRYAGSILGMLWLPLYSALFLGMYSFVFLYVSPGQMQGFSTYERVVFIFSGLVPYLLVSEVIATSVSVVKTNIVIIKTTLFPAELLPVKQVMISLIGGLMNLVILLIMAAPTRFLSWHLFYLPVPLAMAVFSCLAIGWLFATLGVMFPDLSQFINIVTLALLFLAPVWCRLGDVTEFARNLFRVNPLTFLIDSFRYALLGMHDTSFRAHGIALAAAAVCAAVTGVIFRRLRPILVDYE
jgi:lipopolysaccharide transport system permease protein